jgi:hypothetical protein
MKRFGIIRKTFLCEIPSKTSHYGSNNLTKLYFKNSELTINLLYNQFENYLIATDDFEDFSLTTFTKYFNSNFNYSFTSPRTDVCDFCFECLEIGLNNLQQEKLLDYEKHTKKYETYKTFKL